MLPTGPALSAAQKRLLKLYKALPQGDQDSLISFAEFLAERSQASEKSAEDAFPLQPKSIVRPADESVIAAIKRLSETFYMVDRSEVLNETSTLMSSHVLQGRKAAEVIDDLESLFQRQYELYLNSQESKT